MSPSGVPGPQRSDLDSELESTASLLSQVRGGDDRARDRLVRRYLPLLLHWARGRLPARARGMIDTNDLVQITLLQTLDKVKDFEPRREGAFLAYLRRTVLNRIFDEIRRADRSPPVEPFDDEIPDARRSPLENAVGRDVLERYENALRSLPEPQQEAIILRIEFGRSYREIADAVESPSENAARMMVARGLARLAEQMHAS